MGPSVVDAYDLLKMRVINTLTLTDVTSWTPPEAVLSHEEYFALADALIDRCKRSKYAEFAYGVACPNSNTEAMIRRAREEATKNHVRLHVHLAETEYEYSSIKQKHGVTPTRYLDQLGFWGKDTWGAHCIWLDDEDVDILKRHGVGVAHNPKCNMKIADGAAPIRADARKGRGRGPRHRQLRGKRQHGFLRGDAHPPRFCSRLVTRGCNRPPRARRTPYGYHRRRARAEDGLHDRLARAG